MALLAEISGEYFNIHYIHVKNTNKYPELQYRPVPYTVKRVDKVVRHPHLVTQDQFTQVSKKV
jgi:hypothetical protein